MSDLTQDLIGDWLDEGDSRVIDPLAAILRESASARRQFVEAALLESALWRVHAAPPMAPARRLPRVRRIPRPLLIIGLVACLAGVLVCCYFAMKRSETGIMPMAMISNGVSSRIQRDELLIVARGSSATVRFRDGSTIDLEGGTVLRILPLQDGSGAIVHMEAGSASFHLKLGCRNFVVVTPAGEMQALGPEFDVSVSRTPPVMTVNARTGARVYWNSKEMILKAGEKQKFPQ